MYSCLTIAITLTFQNWRVKKEAGAYSSKILQNPRKFSVGHEITTEYPLVKKQLALLLTATVGCRWETAAQITDVAKATIESARIENEFIRLTDTNGSAVFQVYMALKLLTGLARAALIVNAEEMLLSKSGI